MADLAVDVNQLTIRLHHKIILDHIDLKIPTGAFYGIIGPNGAGKTTMFNTIQGFLKPSGGRISTLGMSPYPRNTSLLQRIGIQPQQPAFFSKTTSREHLAAITDIFKAPSERTDELITLFDLAHVANTKVELLSGGERQRLAIASALVHRPSVLFLDEPTATLDPEARRSLITFLRSNAIKGVTIVYTTHRLDEAELLCDTVSILDKGRILAVGSPSRLIADAHLKPAILLPNAVYQADIAVREFGSAAVHVTVDGLRIEGAETAALFQQMTKVGLDMRNVQVHAGNLEDVYLNIVDKDRLQ